MGYLLGLHDYLEKNYKVSVFDKVMASGKPWIFHLHGLNRLCAAVSENRKWDMTLDIEGKGREALEKIQVKFLYPADMEEAVKPVIKTDKKIGAMKLGPIFSPGDRHYVKNKSMFPLMKDREVLFFTLIEGEIIKGIITDFTMYDVGVSLKGGLPVTILRHSINDLKNKKGRSFLKSFQDKHRDWEKSPLFVIEPDSEGTA